MPALTRTGELVTLEIPAQPAYVGVARTVVIAVAAAVDGIDDDRIEDLRVAVSEACTNAVEASRPDADDGRVVIRCAAIGTRLEITIEATGSDPYDLSDGPEGQAPGAVERVWRIQLIQALVDDATFVRTPNGTTVELAMHLDDPA